MSDKSEIKYHILEPGTFKLDGGAMFGIIPKPIWSKVHPSDELNRIELALRLLLIQTPNKNILIDTGIGDYHHEKFKTNFAVSPESHPISLALKEIDLTCNDITDLVISHLHFDHVGGIARKENDQIIPIFENATLHLHRSHYEYAKAPTMRDTGSFQIKIFEPIIDFYRKNKKISWSDGESGTILSLSDNDDLLFKCSHGHTPFLMHPFDNNFIYLADLIPTSNHVHIPWVMGYDISPGITTEDKKRFLDFIIEKKLKVIFEHDPNFWGATISQNEKGHYVCDEKFKSISNKAYVLDC